MNLLLQKRREIHLCIMKATTFFITLFLVVSCAPQKEILHTPEMRLSKVRKPLPVQEPQPEAKPPLEKFKPFLHCDDKTTDFFNSSGIEMLPFIRVVFFDIDQDGIHEMIAGSKDGALRLYRNSGSRHVPRWRLDAGYFDGISAGAFSAPAVGDIDHDGRLDILVGTGGFSKDSGRVLFYKNTGTKMQPIWRKMDIPEVDVGDDATPALADVDHDGISDLIVGNSTGNLFLFRARPNGKGTVYIKDATYFRGVTLGIYVAPAVMSNQNNLVIITGNSLGKLFLLERGKESSSSWKKTALPVSFCSFAAPAFIPGDQAGLMDMVISDGDGQLFYYRNREKNYRVWEASDDYFSGRIFAGPASSPVITELEGRPVLVVGNINGEIRLFTNKPYESGLPWKEVPGFFKGIKLSSFSRGVLTEREGHVLLITSQQDGTIRAFVNTGSPDRPSWSEEKEFFRGIPKIPHAAPAVFDIDGDGKWELIIGGEDGSVRGFRSVSASDRPPAWQKLEQLFDAVKVGRFAAPSLARGEGRTYLFVGQQDGRIRLFIADVTQRRTSVFIPDDYVKGIQVSNHSCPTAFVEKKGFIELAVGDYNGNLKHFACRPEFREMRGN